MKQTGANFAIAHEWWPLADVNLPRKVRQSNLPASTEASNGFKRIAFMDHMTEVASVCRSEGDHSFDGQDTFGSAGHRVIHEDTHCR